MNTDIQNTLQNTAPAATAPKHSIEVLVTTLMDTMHKFAAVLREENALLRSAKFAEIEGIQTQKNDCVLAYKTLLGELFQRKDEFARIDHNLAETLIIKRTQFVELLNLNMRTLATAKTSSRRLVQRILDHAKDAAEDKTNYSNAGVMQASNPRSATSIRYNMEL